MGDLDGLLLLLDGLLLLLDGRSDGDLEGRNVGLPLGDLDDGDDVGLRVLADGSHVDGDNDDGYDVGIKV